MEISKLLEPIGQEQPAGEDVRYDPLFEELQSEVEKLASPSAAGTVDWEGVADLASRILADRSKDLLVTGYLAVALIHSRRRHGVLPALRLYLGIVEGYWDELYPPREKLRGRILALEWWLEKSVRALQLEQVQLEAGEAEKALEVLSEIETILHERLTGLSVEPLRRQLAQAQREETPKSVPAEQGSATEEGDKGAEDPQRSGDADLEGALQRVWRCAQLLRVDDRGNPVAYRVVRQAVWATVSVLPPALEGRTRVPPPDHQQTALLREVRRKGAPEGVVEAAESCLPHFIFWLDLNRLSFEALAALGAPYRPAQEAIVQETLHLLARLPGLQELCFSDGTPFADSDTRRWLEEAAPPASPPLTLTPSLVVDPPGEDGESLATALDEARLLAAQGKLAEGVAALHDKLRTFRSGRERLLWRVALVEFLLIAGSARAALPQLEQVLVDLDHHALDIYDPAVALPALKLAYDGFTAQREPVFKERALAALFRIGRLDPGEMVRLEQGGR